MGVGDIDEGFGFDGIQLTFAIFIELLRMCTGEVAQQKARPLSPLLREEVRKLDQYMEDYKLLCAENIGTAEELSAFRDSIAGQIQALEADREHIRNRIRRTDPETALVLKEQAKEITKQIDPLRKQLRQTDRIMERSEKIKPLLDQERQMETKELQRIREGQLLCGRAAQLLPPALHRRPDPEKHRGYAAPQPGRPEGTMNKMKRKREKSMQRR